jgi:predicted membrane metal-binding protein
MIRILGVNRFPVRVFLSCMALSIVAALAPRWLIPPLVAGGALWIAGYAVRDEVRRLQMPRQWDR